MAGLWTFQFELIAREFTGPANGYGPTTPCVSAKPERLFRSTCCRFLGLDLRILACSCVFSGCKVLSKLTSSSLRVQMLSQADPVTGIYEWLLKVSGDLYELYVDKSNIPPTEDTLAKGRNADGLETGFTFPMISPPKGYAFRKINPEGVDAILDMTGKQLHSPSSRQTSLAVSTRNSCRDRTSKTLPTAAIRRLSIQTNPS